jgi:hypothetical protein
MLKITGLEELGKKLDELSKNAEELSQTKSAKMGEILSPEFISKYTRFASADEFFSGGGFDVSSQEAFEAIEEEKLDAFIRSESSFTSWRELLNTAGAEWAKRKMGFKD